MIPIGESILVCTNLLIIVVFLFYSRNSAGVVSLGQLMVLGVRNCKNPASDFVGFRRETRNCKNPASDFVGKPKKNVGNRRFFFGGP